MNRRRSRLISLGALLALVGVAIGCGSDGADDGPAAANGTSPVAAADAWARTSPSGVTNGAAYVTLTAASDDALIGVEVSATVAKTAQIHETMAVSGNGSSMGSDTTMGTSNDAAPVEMTMRPVDRIDLPAGEAVTLAPGGYHIMLMDLTQPLVVGRTFSIELVFEQAGTQPVTFTVRDDAP